MIRPLAGSPGKVVLGREAPVLRAPATECAYDWFPRVADDLELLEAGIRSWRGEAAHHLRAIAAGHRELSSADRPLLALIAAELRCEEDEGALELGLVTWRTLAADEISALAETLVGALPAAVN
jgi:hypothetical protein